LCERINLFYWLIKIALIQVETEAFARFIQLLYVFGSKIDIA